MTIRELISAIELKHKNSGIKINPPASEITIQQFEHRIGFTLPEDFKEFYAICNGFECNEDIFNIVALQDILDHGTQLGDNWFCFAEYMVYSDAWLLRKKNDGGYEIICSDFELVLTSSLHEFLQRFLSGNVFEPGGLYDWQEKIKANG